MQDADHSVFDRLNRKAREQETRAQDKERERVTGTKDNASSLETIDVLNELIDLRIEPKET